MNTDAIVDRIDFSDRGPNSGGMIHVMLDNYFNGMIWNTETGWIVSCFGIHCDQSRAAMKQSRRAYVGPQRVA
jgi:hypothetical protein